MNHLFEDFPTVSTEQWKDAITALLKGKDYEDALVWETEEGFKVQPFYRKEDLPTTQYKALHKTDNNWNIRERIIVSESKTANKEALESLMKGATAVEFFVPLNVSIDVNVLLKDIELQYAPVYIILEEPNKEVLNQYKSFAGQQSGDIKGGVYVDSLGQLTVGRYPNNVSDLFSNLNSFISEGGKLRFNGVHFRDAGSNITMELAYTLSQVVEVLENTELDFNSLMTSCEFNMGIGPNYFFEIAKKKSLEYLLSKLAEGYNTEFSNCPEYSAISSISNKTIFDPYVNMLRGTTEGMSAAIAGYDNISVLPYNIAFEQGTEFGSRIARNIQLLLKEESYLHNVVDAASGSYYMEHITEELINSSWALFLETEDQNGYLASFKAGNIQNKINEFSQKKSEATINGDNVLLGTNKYPNQEENMGDKVSKTSVHFPPVLSDTLNDYEPIIRFRYSQELDDQRLNSEEVSA